MCIAIAKPAGAKALDMETINNCWSNNEDGAGISWLQDGKVHIRKGFMKIEDFKKFYRKLGKRINMDETHMLLHFRITTDGSTCQGNCHPFPISKQINELKATEIVTDAALVHNGIMSNYRPKGTDKALDMSDTQVFAKNLMTKVKETDPYFRNKTILGQIGKKISGNKVAILTKKGISLIGTFEKFEGVYYSNSSYSYNWGDYLGYYGGGYSHNTYKPKENGYLWHKQRLEEFLEFMNMMMTLPENYALSAKELIEEFLAEGTVYLDSLNYMASFSDTYQPEVYLDVLELQEVLMKMYEEEEGEPYAL